MVNTNLKTILVYGAFFCAGIIAGHLLTGSCVDSPQPSLTPVQDIHPAPKNFSANTTSELGDQRITLLKKELAQMLKKTALQEKYISFLSGVVDDNLDSIIDGTGNQPIDVLIAQQLEAMDIDDQEMLALIQSFINIESSDVPLQISMQDFAAQLVRIAANGVLTPLSAESRADTNHSLPISFDTSIIQSSHSSLLP